MSCKDHSQHTKMITWGQDLPHPRWFVPYAWTKNFCKLNTFLRSSLDPEVSKIYYLGFLFTILHIIGWWVSAPHKCQRYWGFVLTLKLFMPRKFLFPSTRSVKKVLFWVSYSLYFFVLLKRCKYFGDVNFGFGK